MFQRRLQNLSRNWQQLENLKLKTETKREKWKRAQRKLLRQNKIWSKTEIETEKIGKNKTTKIVYSIYTI